MMHTNIRRPIAYVLASTNHGTMLVNRHDYQLVQNGGFGVGYQLLNASSFDPGEVNLALQLLQKRRLRHGDGVVALDCGANIGVHTVEWAKLMYGWGSVIAFEAQEWIYYALAGNIAINNCFNARAIYAAVGASRGEIGVPVPNYFVPSSFGSLEIHETNKTEFIGQNIDYTNVQRTKLIAIDDLALERLDLIKIDVEGMEMEALNGALDTIQRTRPQILIETIKSDKAQIVEFLSKLGYTTFPAGINTLAIHDSDPTAKDIVTKTGQA
jgi:FkbM family methyltransferase